MAQAAIMLQRARGVGRIVARHADGRTRLAELYQEGSAKIRLPETYTPAMEAILINSSGGVTGGDQLDWSASAEAGANLTVTTQACEKVYKSGGGAAEVATRLTVGPRAHLHWLPQETILFETASLMRTLDADLDETAEEFLCVEAMLLGRKAMGEAMTRGLFRDRWRVRRGGALIHAEDVRLDGGIGALTAEAAVLGGGAAFATVLYIAPDAEAMLAKARGVLGSAMGGASFWSGKLVMRIAAADGMSLRRSLVPLLAMLRKGAPLPKAWTL